MPETDLTKLRVGDTFMAEVNRAFGPRLQRVTKVTDRGDGVLELTCVDAEWSAAYQYLNAQDSDEEPEPLNYTGLDRSFDAHVGMGESW